MKFWKLKLNGFSPSKFHILICFINATSVEQYIYDYITDADEDPYKASNGTYWPFFLKEEC